MAKYLITYACGCTHEKQLFGKIDERLSYIDRCSTRECDECARKHTDEQARQHSSDNYFPPLTGSDKQIAWATTLRYLFVVGLDKYIEGKMKLVNDKNREKAMASLAKIYETRDAMIANETSASWWIDRRNDESNWMVADYIKNK